jgi:hypothetical protein
MVEKKAIRLYESCRGSRDLQLWYSSVCPLQFNLLEKLLVKVGQSELFWHQRSRARAEQRRCALPRFAAVGPLGPDSEAGYHPLVRAPWGRPRRTAFSALPLLHVSSATWPHRADLAPPGQPQAAVHVAHSTHAGAHAATIVAFVRAKSSTTIRSLSFLLARACFLSPARSAAIRQCAHGEHPLPVVVATNSFCFYLH